MTLFCFLASLTSLSWGIWVTKGFFFIRIKSYCPKLKPKTRVWKKHCVFVAASAEIRFPLECIAACLLRWPRPDTQAPLRISGSALWDLCCWCALALYPKCLPTKQTSVRARFRTTYPGSPACVCSCPATPRADIEHYGMRKSVLFLFRIQWSFFEIMLPTLDQFETLVKNRSPSIQRSCKLHLSCQPSPALLCFFESDHFLAPSWKTLWPAMPMAAMELKHLVCFPTKTIPWISCNSSFPSLATHLMMDMHTPPLGLVFHPADRLSRIRPVAVERFFVSSFERLDSLSSTHHHRHSSRTSLCMPLQMACFGESCLTFCTCIMFRHFVGLRDQQSVLFVNAYVYLGNPDLVKA